MAHVFVSCPKCGAGYKVAKEHLATPAVCRACGHRWVPAEAPADRKKGEAGAQPAQPSQRSPASEGKPPPSATEGKRPTSPASAKPVQPKPADGDAADALASLAAARKQKPATSPTLSPAGKETLADQAEAKPAAPETDPLIGRQVNGFKIQDRLGTGGFGIVYRAFDTNLERSVAIKMLPANIAKAGKGVVERFLREARSAAKLAHPNIVTIHQICPYQNTYYIVMELIDDGALHEVLAKGKPRSPPEATRIVRAAAEGLAHAHKRGIIHRDIKPGNIMLTSDGQVKVSDFGLARDVLQGRDILGAGHSLGTPRYMAPEQALGHEPSAASDLYSLAATYYILLTGRPAFDGADDRDIMKKQVQAPVPDPRRYRPDLPPAAFRFFEKAMAKEPADRYATAEDFIEALDRLDFSKAGADLSDSEDLADQLGAVAAEDRGSQLSKTLGRAARRAHRQRTPMSESAIEDMFGSSAAAGRKAGWKLWLLIGALVLLLVIGAVVAAILLAPDGPETARPEGGKPNAAMPEAATEAAKPDEEKPETDKPEAAAEAPDAEHPSKAGPTPAGAGQPAEKPSATPLEEAAREMLEEVREYETLNPDTAVYELIRMYRESVIQVYPDTKAADEARRAIERLRKGKRLQEGAVGEKEPPQEEPPEEPPAEPPGG